MTCIIHRQNIGFDLPAQQHIIDLMTNAPRTSMLQGQVAGWTTRKIGQRHIREPRLWLLVNLVGNIMARYSDETLDLLFWFVGVEPGGTIAWHDHNQTDLAAVYYPQTIRPDCGGQIEFEDGSVVQPESGLLLVFSGMDRHRVLPYQGDGERLSVAFNRVTGDMG